MKLPSLRPSLSRTTERVIRKLIPIVCPLSEHPADMHERLTDLTVRELRAAIEAMPLAIGQGIRFLAHVFEWSATASHRGQRGTQLSATEAERHFEQLYHGSATHMLFKNFKGLICVAYYDQPETWAGIGYAPQDWIAKVTEERYANYGEEIAAAEEALFAPDPMPPLVSTRGSAS